jgi:hypothetical protein
MTIADEIYDAFIDSTCDKPFTAEAIQQILEKRLYTLLCEADGMLSAIRHGRVIEDKEIEAVYYPIRAVCDDLRSKTVY